LEQAATVLALERIKEREIEEVKLKIREDFFDDLLLGKITSNETLKSLCDLHNLNFDYKYYCIVINVETEKEHNEEDLITSKFRLEKITKKCVEIVYNFAYQMDGEITCFQRNSRVIILVG